VEDVGNAIQNIPEGYGVVRELVGHGLEKMHEDPEMPNYGKDEENFCRRYGGCHRTDDQHGTRTSNTKTVGLIQQLMDLPTCDVAIIDGNQKFYLLLTCIKR
jgi:hypothetical protein